VRCRPFSFQGDRPLAKHILNQDQTTPWYIDESGDEWILARGTSLSANASIVVSEGPDQHDNTIVINGSVSVNTGSGFSHAIYLNGNSTDLIIGAQGTVTSGQHGVGLAGTHQSVTNRGTIDVGENIGVHMYSDHATINNFGTIKAYTGIDSLGQSSTIVNQAGGEIKATGYAIYGSGDFNDTIVNEGRLEGGLFAIRIDEGDDRVTNHGKIIGNVDLGAGDDVFDTRGGKVSGTVAGGSGKDTYLVSNAAVDIKENYLLGGMDTVKSTVSYTIDTFIENVSLLGGKNIDAVGNELANVLRGNNGDNILRGLKGADALAGGDGNDRLVGGKDSDSFVFRTGGGHDTIADFDADAGDWIDLGGMDAIKSYKDLVNHHLQASGDDLLITAGDDQIRIRNFGEADIKADMFDFA
jgi:Ca2+-binding RTX toxin-like protein